MSQPHLHPYALGCRRAARLGGVREVQKQYVPDHFFFMLCDHQNVQVLQYIHGIDVLCMCLLRVGGIGAPAAFTFASPGGGSTGRTGRSSLRVQSVLVDHHLASVGLLGSHEGCGY